MFSLHMSPSFEGEVQTIRLKRDPFRCGLGRYEDFDGISWDVYAIIGVAKKPYVNACRVSELHPYYGSTASENYGFVSQTWDPHYVVVVDDKNNAIKDYRNEIV